MIEIALSKEFINVYRKFNDKKYRGIEENFDNKLKIFLANPFDTRLNTKRLPGTLSYIWSFDISLHYKITFMPVGNNKYVFENIEKMKMSHYYLHNYMKLYSLAGV
jgi:hypothetical protein